MLRSESNIYFQVKKEAVNLNKKNQDDLNGEAYLITTDNNIDITNTTSNIYDVFTEDLYDIAIDNHNPAIIRAHWLDFLKEVEKKSNGQNKVIILDTNKTYSITNEADMLLNNKSAPYSNVTKGVSCFN